jgi:hypothetical protein
MNQMPFFSAFGIDFSNITPSSADFTYGSPFVEVTMKATPSPALLWIMWTAPVCLFLAFMCLSLLCLGTVAGSRREAFKGGVTRGSRISEKSGRGGRTAPFGGGGSDGAWGGGFDTNFGDDFGGGGTDMQCDDGGGNDCDGGGVDVPDGFDNDGGDTCGGCFSGPSPIRMANGSLKPAKDVEKGDRVCCGGGGGDDRVRCVSSAEQQTAQVRCVVVMGVPNGRTRMVHFPNGLALTPGHPVLDRSSGKYTAAEDFYAPKMVRAKSVYNFLLDRDRGVHTVDADGVECVVMGHGGDESRRHAFWGNWQRVAGCLQRADAGGFEHGRVYVAGTVRHARTGMVCGFTSLDGRRVICNDDDDGDDMGTVAGSCGISSGSVVSATWKAYDGDAVSCY